jgi:hypothetical protein
MKQLEIDYFWPLTEQIPLGLNYEGCEKPKLTTPIDTNGITYTVGAWDTETVSITASHLNLDIDTTVVKVKETPNLCSRIIYKCLGLKWEKK